MEAKTEAKAAKPTTVDEYIAQCPVDVQPILQQLRAVIRESAPEAQERISYGMPGYYLNGSLVWFGAHKRHIGFYPHGNAPEPFRQELAGYKQSKGAIQLPLDKPMPYDLIARIVRYRVAENSKKK
jgi:uncharacterized protein YdhG (YjbR/CyaY superfamily)